jgi:Family of unknown function (DUF6281)
MWRSLAIVAALAALAVAPVAVPASGAGCVTTVAWHATHYKHVATTARFPLGPRLGTGTRVRCATTSTDPYAPSTGATARRSVYAVPGVRTKVAVALRAATPLLYVSSAAPTAAERRVLNRLRGR